MAEYTTDADKAKRDRYLYVMALLVGQRGEADLEGKKIEGVLHTSTPFADLPHKIVLKGARVVDDADPAMVASCDSIILRRRVSVETTPAPAAAAAAAAAAARPVRRAPPGEI